MKLFMVDPDKCKLDGICIDECPMGIIEYKNKNSLPTPTEDANELCIKCGHCVTVCPEGAFFHSSMTPEQCPPVHREWFLDPERVEHFLRSRRSIRTYKNRTVDRDTLSRLIGIARFAPSGHNLQPVRWLIIYDSNEVRQLTGLTMEWIHHMLKEKAEVAKKLHMDRVLADWEAGIDRICRGGPHVIIAHAPKEEQTAPAACTIALTYLELAAPSFGLGACWAGYFNIAANVWPPMRKVIGLPEGHMSFGTMIVGFPKYKYHRLPIRNEARITWR